jgi:Carboxypeptidase regulatory-like domain/TonB dependent receptor
MRKRQTISQLTVAVTLLAVTFLINVVVAAQETRGSIRGVVTDASGALVPNASITVVNMGTNVGTTVTTSESGVYFVPNLPPGVYTVTVEQQGFQKAIRENVRVDVATSTVADAQLTVGEVSQSVTVTAQAEVPITTTSGDRGVIVGTKTLLELPTELSKDNRRIESFAFLTPGVTGDTFTVRINGSPAFSTEILMDGMPFLDGCCNGELESYEPPYESVDEFKMQTNAYSAEYGRGVGVMNFHFRSGTNQFHGDVYDFLRNDALDAAGHFNPSVSINKQNEFGVTTGGPVYIPKVYDGRNKTFWHATMTWFRFRGAIRTSLISVPTNDFQKGDFTKNFDAAGNLIPIYDPATTRPDGLGGLTRDQFQCNGVLNVICPDRFSALSAPFLPLMPTATNQNKTFNNLLAGVPSAPINNHYYLFKVDHNINDKTSLHVSYYRAFSDAITPAAFTGPMSFETDTLFSGYMVRGSVDRNISPNLLNTFGATWQRPQGCNCRVPSQQTILDNAIAPSGSQMPGFNIAGYAPLGSGFAPLFSYLPGVGIQDNLTWTHGRHVMKIGFEMRQEDQTVIADTTFPGIYGFSTATTSLPDSPNFGTFGNAFASFLLGLPTSVTKTFPLGFRSLRTAYRAFYFQDDYRITSKLTLNLGVRYDIPIGVTEKEDRLGTLDLTVPNPGAGNIPGALVFAGRNGGPCLSQGGASTCQSHLAPVDYKEVQPRLGFAYRLNDRTVVRGGYGLTFIAGGSTKIFGPVINSNFLAGYRSQQALTSLDGGISPIAAIDPTNVTNKGWDQGLPPIPAPVRTLTAANNGNIDYWDPKSGRQTYMQMWSLTVERELPGKIALEVSYVGNKGTRLNANEENLNQVRTKWLSLGNELVADVSCLGNGTCPNAVAAGVKLPYAGFTGSIAQALRPFPQYTSVQSLTQETGSSTYNGLQARAQKSFSNGVSFLVAYTWSKTLSDSVLQFGAFNPGAIDTYDRGRDKAPLPDGYPQVLALSTVYELPFGPTKRFASRGGALGKVVGGWQLGYIGNYRSGPFLPISGGDSLPLFNAGNRPNVVPGASQVAFSGGKFNPATEVYLNAAAFSQPGPFKLGNAPRYLGVRGFGFYNENLTLLKRTRITERTNVEFRSEFFNLFNRTGYGGNINTNFNDTAGFGVVSAQENQPRQIQVSLKFNW